MSTSRRSGIPQSDLGGPSCLTRRWLIHDPESSARKTFDLGEQPRRNVGPVVTDESVPDDSNRRWWVTHQLHGCCGLQVGKPMPDFRPLGCVDRPILGNQVELVQLSVHQIKLCGVEAPCSSPNDLHWPPPSRRCGARSEAIRSRIDGVSDFSREDNESPDLVRYWFEFELTGYTRPVSAAGTVSLDGEPPALRLLGRGVGVTGYSEIDCLELLQAHLDEALPTVSKRIRNVDVSALGIDRAGNPSWRGVWFPNFNGDAPQMS